MAVKKILITVKTYPTLSRRYDELVCTAGMLEDGSWIRLYPIPFRKLDYINQYKKYDWIEVDVTENKSDWRPESFRPVSEETTIKIIGNISSEDNWEERKKIVLKKIYTNLSSLISDAKDRNKVTSLATFKPTIIHDFIVQRDSKDWDPKKLEALSQMNLFEKRNREFQIVRKLPFKFSYKFEDDSGRTSKLMIEDWETGALFWKMIKKYGDENIACEKVKDKYLNDFAKTKDLHFFLGTTKLNQFRAPNPFIIVGTFHPKIETPNLFNV